MTCSKEYAEVSLCHVVLILPTCFENIIFLLWFFLSRYSFSWLFKLWHWMIIDVIHISIRKPLFFWPCEVSTRSLSLEASVMIQDLTLHPHPRELSFLYKIKINLKLIYLEFWRTILPPIFSRHAMREKSELTYSIVINGQHSWISAYHTSAFFA